MHFMECKPFYSCSISVRHTKNKDIKYKNQFFGSSYFKNFLMKVDYTHFSAE